jgi:hypothetical protein
LSGSRIVIFCVWSCLIFSCAGPRHATAPPSTPTVPEEEKVTIYDPKSGSEILVPRDAIKVDTIEWTKDPVAPIVIENIIIKDKPIIKTAYDIAFLMPFNAVNAELFGDQIDPKLNRFIQYYAGITLAKQRIDSAGIAVKVHSYDVTAANTTIDKIIGNPELKNADVVVGPYEKKELEVVASYGLENEVMVVSPWLPSYTTETENPFFIQLFPSLSTHAQAILEYIRDEMAGKKVFVVARNNAAETNRIKLFTTYPDVKAEELIITDTSPDLEKTDLHKYLDDDNGTIFILPYYAKTDESFVNSFMRKLHAEKDTREAIVFGLPQWVGYSNLNGNYMESLSLHLSISSFIDIASPEYATFRANFLSRFHTVPDLNAFLGYDLMMWLADKLSTGGQEGLIGQMDPSQYGLASGFDIRPVYKSNSATDKVEMKMPLYYENRRVRILHYIEKDYVLVR